MVLLPPASDTAPSGLGPATLVIKTRVQMREGCAQKVIERTILEPRN
jgi:hypothetical protein